MRIEKIRFNKIKVTFSTEDLIMHGLTPEAVRRNSPAAQDVFWSVLKQAEEEIGFSAENGRLMIEAHAFKDDSLVLYITKLDAEDDFAAPFSPAKRKAKLRVRAVDPLAENADLCIEFGSFDDAVALAHAHRELCGGEMYVYRDMYYLIISNENERACSEFGKIVRTRFFPSALCEHGKLICSNAFETLRENF